MVSPNYWKDVLVWVFDSNMGTMERDKLHINRNYSWAYTLVFFRNRLLQIWLSKPELAETKATWVWWRACRQSIFRAKTVYPNTLIDLLPRQPVTANTESQILVLGRIPSGVRSASLLLQQDYLLHLEWYARFVVHIYRSFVLPTNNSTTELRSELL